MRGTRQPLHYAAMNNEVAEVEARLSAGDDPNVGDRQGFTPPHMAAQSGAVEAAGVLLDRGAAVDQANAFGNTPFCVAVFNSRGMGGMIGLLRQHGADPLRVNNMNRSRFRRDPTHPTPLPTEPTLTTADPTPV